MTYLTPEMVAERVHMNPVTIRRLCQRGVIEAYRPNNRWLITEDAVAAWVEGAKHKPAETPEVRGRVVPASSFRRKLQAIQSNTGGLDEHRATA